MCAGGIGWRGARALHGRGRGKACYRQRIGGQGGTKASRSTVRESTGSRVMFFTLSLFAPGVCVEQSRLKGYVTSPLCSGVREENLPLWCRLLQSSCPMSSELCHFGPSV